MTLQLLWAEYVARHGEWAYRYSRFCGRYREWRARQKRSLRQQHRAGEKAFIDYCGPTVPIVDRHTGEIRDAQVFVGVLGASSYNLRRGHPHPVTARLDRLPSAHVALLRWRPRTGWSQIT